MPQSRFWRELDRQIARLRGQFLPDPFDPTGSYAELDRVQAYTRAYLVLAHAEIETFLEEWAKDLARASEKLWDASRRLSPPLLSLVAFSAERPVVPDAVPATGGKDSQQRLVDAVAKIFPAYYKRIKDNHGVKEASVHSLFGPLGIPISAAGLTLLPALDDLGTRRGDHAHHSVRAVSNVLDPLTEHTRITGIISDLAMFDAFLVGFRRKIR